MLEKIEFSGAPVSKKEKQIIEEKLQNFLDNCFEDFRDEAEVADWRTVRQFFSDGEDRGYELIVKVNDDLVDFGVSNDTGDVLYFILWAKRLRGEIVEVCIFYEDISTVISIIDIMSYKI